MSERILRIERMVQEVRYVRVQVDEKAEAGLDPANVSQTIFIGEDVKDATRDFPWTEDPWKGDRYYYQWTLAHDEWARARDAAKRGPAPQVRLTRPGGGGSLQGWLVELEAGGTER